MTLHMPAREDGAPRMAQGLLPGREAGRDTRRTYRTTAIVAATPQQVWAVLSDVVRWPEWTTHVTSVEPLGPSPLAMGARYRIDQPRLRPAVWTVVGLEPLRSFSWEALSPGVRALGVHSLATEPDGSTCLELQIQFSGPLSVLASTLYGRLTTDYLLREAAALKRRCEAT